MKVYTLHRKQLLPIGMEEAWKFFSSPFNLEKITPPYMRFKIITRLEDLSIHEGMNIQYIVRPILGIPLKWETIITSVDKPYQFTDKQAKGPYALWEHRHIFRETAMGVEMTDEVRYALPFGVLGRIAHGFKVKAQLEEIFDYRQKVLKDLFLNKNEYSH